MVSFGLFTPVVRAIMAECLFNTAVPVTIRSAPFTSNFTPTPPVSYPFYSTAAPINFHDPSSGRRISSVLFEINLIPIVAHKKSLQLKVSDVNDPFFMWQLELTEEEFFSLRSEQNLLVDFAYFPYKLIELLQRCLSAANEQPPSFVAQLSVGQDSVAHLSFLETTSFRQVTLLSLKLKTLNDEVMKRQFSDLLRQYREQIAFLQSQLTPPTPPASAQQTKKPVGVNSTKLPTGMNTLVREKDEACAHLNQLYEATREAKTRADDDNAHFKQENEALKKDVEASQAEIMKANEIIARLQDELRNFKAKLKSATSIADDQMASADSLRITNKRLQQDYNELADSAHTAKLTAENLERDNKALRAQVEALEKKLFDRDAIIGHLQRANNAKDLDQALRGLEIKTEGSSTAPTGTDFTFDSTPGVGYVGSKIFTDASY